MNSFIDRLRSCDPGKAVLREGNRFITAGELYVDSHRLAVSMLHSGVRKGDRVLMALPPGVEFLKIIYANMMVGTVVSIIDPEMGRDNYQAKLKQFSPQHVFADSRLVFMNEHPLIKFMVLLFRKRLPSLPRITECNLFTSGPGLPVLQKHTRLNTLISHEYPSPESVRADVLDEFLVIYTSGTLAEPKGVVHTFDSLDASIGCLGNLLAQNNDLAIATHLPHFMLLGINAGLRIHLWDNEMLPDKKLDFIIRHRITTLFGPPSDFMPLVIHLEQRKEQFPECIKNIYLGSAPIYGSFLQRLIPRAGQTRITCLYGMTENLMVTYQDGREKAVFTGTGDPVGKAFPGVIISIAKDHEIQIDSKQMFARYWMQIPQTGSHSTGDLGDFDGNGNLVLIGRKKEMIIRRNFNIYPGLYEPTINKIEGVIEAVMIGIYNQTREDEDVILVVEARNEMTADGILKRLKSGEFSIDREAWPDKVIFMKLPRWGRQQKVNRKLLQQLLIKKNG